MFPEFYLDVRKVDPIFRIADEYMEEQCREEYRKMKPIEVRPPFIDSNPNVKGPLYVTEGWFVKTKKKQLTERTILIKEAKIQVLKYQAKINLIRYKIGQLNRYDPKDIKKIVDLNVKLKDYQVMMQSYIDLNGIKDLKIDYGTKIGFYVGMIKRFCKKTGKKFLKYFGKHSDTIAKIVGVALPVLTVLIFGPKAAAAVAAIL